MRDGRTSFLLMAAAFVMVAPACFRESLAKPPMGAHFKNSGTVITDTFEADARGGTFTVPSRGTPADGVVLELPENAVSQPFRLDVGYCTGTTTTAAGKPSDVVLIVKATPDLTFDQPMKITVRFPPDERHATMVGYAIDENGRFRPIDLIDADLKVGRASFLTFQPLTLTWVYVER